MRAEIDDNAKVDAPGGGRDDGDVAGPDAVGKLGQGLVEQEVGGWLVSPAVAGFRQLGFGLGGFEVTLEHDPANLSGGTGDALAGGLVDVADHFAKLAGVWC